MFYLLNHFCKASFKTARFTCVTAGDLRATEMTMNDNDRIQLMLLVKEGKISVQEAVDTVSQSQS